MTNQPAPSLRVERDGAVAEVVLDRPGRLNAMEPSFFRELREEFAALRDDESVRAVLIWGEGRVFSTGLDRSRSLDLVPPVGPGVSEARRNHLLHAVIREFQRSIGAVAECPKPVIAAVHGLCIGGGLDLAAACDIRMCAADAQFSLHETKVAMVADLGALQRLTRLVGPGLAREMAYTGDPIAAPRALAFGLVNEIHPDKTALLAAARALAARIAANAPAAVQGVKEVLGFAERYGERAGLEQVALWNSAFFFSRDLEESFRAFAEKRDPAYDGS